MAARVPLKMKLKPADPIVCQCLQQVVDARNPRARAKLPEKCLRLETLAWSRLMRYLQACNAVGIFGGR
jgi:hypothetical protein